MLIDFDVQNGVSSKGGIFALRKAEAMQPPTGVPAKGGPSTVAEVTLPLGAKQTLTLPLPVGPSGFLQPFAAPAAAPSAALAAPRSMPLPLAATAVSAG